MKNYRIENDFLCVSIDVKKKIKAFSLYNKLTGKEIKFAQGSELFNVNFRSFPFPKLLKASELSVSQVLERKEGEGQELEIIFDTVSVKGEKLGLSLLYELFNKLLLYNNVSTSRDKMYHAIHYLENNYLEDISATQLAEMAMLGESMFRRNFKHITGMSHVK